MGKFLYSLNFFQNTEKVSPKNEDFCTFSLFLSLGTLRTNDGGAFPAHKSKGSMFPLEDDGHYCVDHNSHYIETWSAMEKLVDKGMCRAIGLSNFNRKQVLEVIESSSKHKPTVLQNECHPYLQQKDLVDFCRIYGMQRCSSQKPKLP